MGFPLLSSRLCAAGVRSLEVPAACPHAIEPHWSRSLLLKHHQWLALNRDHAIKLTDRDALEFAVAVFEEMFLGEPVCSDEVVPLLALAAPDNWKSNRIETKLSNIPLYRDGAARGLEAFDMVLKAQNISAECITYAPWSGCFAGMKHVISTATTAAQDKRAK